LEEFVKFHILFLLAIITLTASLFPASAQIDTVLGQITASNFDTYAGGMSGDGRLVVFESEGNLATENPRNADRNREIFIFDYAQRRIFQITDTKSVLTDTTKEPTFDNVKVDITNIRPVISNDGRWIAFGSNATTSTPTAPNSTNPGSFDGNSFTPAMGANPLTLDGNTEIWLYQIPALAPADLSSGADIAITNLSAGTFTRVTNTNASRTPVAGTATTLPVIADDNFDASINDDGGYIAFVSNRDLVPCQPATAVCGNAIPFDNSEIFAYVRSANAIRQITATARGTVGSPLRSLNPTISGNGLRVLFYSNTENPIVGMTGGVNSGANKNDEIYYADLDGSGLPSGTKKQVTTTTPGTPGEVLNLLNYGERMSRDGRYIAFDSFADLANENSGANYTSFALIVYDATLNTFRRVGPRSNADAGASGGDVAHYPGFTENDVNGTPSRLILETRLNIKADGTIPATASDGLNPETTRPVQIYSYSLDVPPATATFTRRTKLPAPFFVLASAQPLTSDSVERMSFNLAQTEPGTGNFDLSAEVFYLLTPEAVQATKNPTLNYFTGASRIPVSASPVPTPTPGTTPTPSPSPTPQTPPAVQGVSSGMLAILDYIAPGLTTPVTPAESVGSLDRRFTLPIELSGVTMTINGAACGLKRVSQSQIIFVVPPGLSVDSTTNTAVYPVVINNNGTVIKGNITIVPGRPDIFTNLPAPGPGGRARIFNATNAPFLNGEPFAVTTIKRHGAINNHRRVQTVLRVYLTGVNNFTGSLIKVKVGNRLIEGSANVSDATLREPGVYSVDFLLPPELSGAGDVPIIISVTVNNVTYTSRLDDTAARLFIL
jgi:uncharacterized protein (TIGR03437 family)